MFSTKTFEKNEYLFEYKGQLLYRKQALKRYNDPLYEEGKSFFYFFTYDSKRFCIDACFVIFSDIYNVAKVLEKM